jgi:hypothetical protein
MRFVAGYWSGSGWLASKQGDVGLAGLAVGWLVVGWLVGCFVSLLDHVTRRDIWVRFDTSSRSKVPIHWLWL